MPKFFDFCAGIGAAHLAFDNLGAKCAGYSEIDIKAEKTYQLFFGNHHKNYGDLMQISPEKLPKFDVLLAGFPCQPFSIVGKRAGIEDNRGQVIYGISNILKQTQPKAFLLENVKGLININNGEIFRNILDLLGKTNYKVFYKVIDSINYIPQMRERIYFVGIRKDLCKQDFVFPQISENDADIKKYLIDDNPQLKLQGIPHQTFLRYLQNKYNKDKFDLKELLAQDYLVLDTRQSDLRLYRGKVPTIRTGRQGILYVKNGELRKLSGLEALLLQGFDFERATKLQSTLSQTNILSQAGNAMTVSVIQAIGKNLFEYLG